jgi:Xaa-Pro aminopeptidase
LRLPSATSRADRARALLDEAGLDALVVSGDFSAGMNYFWLSGHMPRDFQLNYSRPHLMVLPLHGEPFLYVYDVNAENARASSWVEDVVAYTPPFSGADFASAVRSRLGSAKLGLELGEDQRLFFPAGELRHLGDVVDATPLLTRLRMLKDDEEIAAIERACAVNGDGIARAFARLGAGDDEHEVARALGASIVEAGAVRPPYAQLNVLSEAKSRALGGGSRLLGPLPEYSLAEGDLLFVDTGAIVDGYWGEFARMASVGEPAPVKVAHHDAIRDIVSRSIAESLHVGASFREIVEHLASLYRDHGYGDDQYGAYLRTPPLHYCHGVGLCGSEPPFIRHDSDDVLEAGMAITPEAYLYVDGMLYASEEDVVITEAGPRLLSPRDAGLARLGVV